MIHSLIHRKAVLVVLAIATTVAFTTIVMPAIGGLSLKALVKKEVRKQIAGKTGPQGAQGAQGVQGPTASAEASVSSTTVLIGTAATNLISANITITTTSRIMAQAHLQILGAPPTLTRDTFCRLVIGGTNQQRSAVTFPNGVTRYESPAPLGAAVKPPGTYTVTAQCENNDGADPINFKEGDLNVWAVAS